MKQLKRDKRLTILVPESIFQQLRLQAFYGNTSINELVNQGISKILRPVRKEEHADN